MEFISTESPRDTHNPCSNGNISPLDEPQTKLAIAICAGLSWQKAKGI